MTDRECENLLGYKAISLEEWTIPEGASEAEVAKALEHPLYRICNIYTIEDADGIEIPFEPNWAQRVILYDIYIAGHRRVAIPKARQLGFSTLISIVLFDRSYFGGKRGDIVDQDIPSAKEKVQKVRLAYTRLPPSLLEGDAPKTDNGGCMEWHNGGIITGGKNMRGGTTQFLHVSEIGVIAYEDPLRAEEIVTGAIPAASGSQSIIVLESTFKGGRGGFFFETIDRGLKTLPEDMTDKDYVVRFFPWWIDGKYVLSGRYGQVNRETREYFTKMEERTGYQFTDEQKLWYFKEKATQGQYMRREYPTTIEEMWSVAEKGSIYAADMDKAIAQGRVNNNVLYYDQMPVYIAYDIGMPVNTVGIVFQVIGDRINVLECLTGDPITCNTPANWWERLKLKAYRWGSVFLPHDGAVTWLAALREAGCDLAKVLKRPMKDKGLGVMGVWVNINHAQKAFGRCYFNEEGCKDLINALHHYHAKEESDGRSVKNVPVHDWASHYCTAFGYMHQAIISGALIDRSGIQERPRQSRPKVIRNNSQTRQSDEDWWEGRRRHTRIRR